MPAAAQASSFSPPGAPLTPTAPINEPPARIGSPPEQQDAAYLVQFGADIGTIGAEVLGTDTGHDHRACLAFGDFNGMTRDVNIAQHHLHITGTVDHHHCRVVALFATGLQRLIGDIACQIERHQFDVEHIRRLDREGENET
jgi:hypothetical protein